jgi:hypothetical protein
VETIIAAALGALGLIIVSLIGLYGARKIGIGQNQERLVNTLKDLIEAQNKKILALEQTRDEDRGRIEVLERRVAELSALTVSQALEIEHLRNPVRTQIRQQHKKVLESIEEGGE